MKKLFFAFVLLFTTIVAIGQVNKIVIKTSQVRYGSIVNDVMVDDGK